MTRLPPREFKLAAVFTFMTSLIGAVFERR